jgi:ATP-dependent Clp protease ATP-binding subunit ClpB
MTKSPGTAKDDLLIKLEEYISLTHPEFELAGCENEVIRLCSNLSRSTSHNIIYAGPSGVGKTADLYGIAMKLKQATDDPASATAIGLPLEMAGKNFLRLDVDNLFDDHDPRLIQENIKRVFVQLEQPGEHVLVIEDANDFLKALTNNQCFGMLSSLMGKLRRREFQTFWMVREEAGKNRLEELLDSHSEIRELFTVIEKAEPNENQILRVLNLRKKRMEAHYEGLTISDEAVLEVVKLTLAYPNLKMWTQQQPARSISLLDRIASKFIARAQTRPPELAALEEDLAALDENAAPRRQELTKRIEVVTAEWKTKAQKLFQVQAKFREWQQKYSQIEREQAAARTALIQDLQEEKEAAGERTEVTDYEVDQRKTPDMRRLEEELRVARGNLDKITKATTELKATINAQFVLGKREVDDIFGDLSGIPVADLDADETEKILNLDRKLKASVYGQDAVIDIMADTIKSAKAGLKSPKRPMGIFICLGSSGVGKSYLAQVVARELFGGDDSLTQFDMSEFMEKHTVSQLKGAPPGYAGYGEGGRLTNAVRRKPYQAILLDEVEKAHPDIFKILLQVFNDGRLSDELGTVHYNNTVIFLTTNLAQQLALEGKIDPHSPEGREAVIAELKQHFPQELLNRVDEFLLFNPLSAQHIKRVVQRDIAELNAKSALQEKNIRVTLSDEDIDRIVEDKYRVEEGARQVQKFIENRMSAGLVPILLQYQKGGGGTIQVRYAPELPAAFAYDVVLGAATT